MAAPVRIIRITDWQQYIRLIQPGSGFDSWAFRGQADARWPLNSSLSRYFQRFGVLKRYWPDQEARIVRIFRRKAHLHLAHIPPDDDDFQWLSIMQHHGAPTRLIDFTWSPYVAAFFALENAVHDAAVWAVHPGLIWQANDSPRGRRARFDISLRSNGVFEKRYQPNKHKFVYQGEPDVMTQRLTTQNGTFLVPGVLDIPLDEILAAYPSREPLVTKFEFKSNAVRDDAMQALYSMNVTYASLFPDLDGLARSLAYELEFHWAIDPKTGDLARGFEKDPYFGSRALRAVPPTRRGRAGER